MKIPANYLKGLLMAVLFFFPVMASPQQSDWIWQNPLPQGNYLWDLQLIDANTLFAIGQGGTVMKSTDAGVHWTIQNTGNTKLLRRAKFLQKGKIGFASGANSTLIKTTDGGENWQKLTINQNTDIYAMDFPDEHTGFVAGNPGYRIYKTVDGGSIWSQSDSMNLSSISVIKFPFDNLTGFTSGYQSGTSNGVIYKTIDGGVTWIKKSVPVGSEIKSFWFINSQTAYAAGYRTILKTTDSGETWVSVYTGNGSFRSICFPENEATGYAVGDYNTVLKTTDGGSSWQTINTGGTGQQFYNAVGFVNNQMGFIVGANGIILKTTNGGINWQNLSTTVTQASIKSIDFPVNAQTGYATGLGAINRILKTTDGGDTWIPQSVNTSRGFFKIHFLDNDTGYVVGENGAMMKTMNGGQNWDYILSGIDQYLFDVEFPVNSRVGYVSGGSGKLAKTTDGGNTWTSIGTFNKDIKAMCFPTDNLVGYVATAYQRIYKTTDGGITWKIKYDGNIPGSSMSDILFPFDTLTGYALSYGNGSKILKTTDGGNNWQVIDPGISQELLSISFPTPKVGYIAAFHDNFSSILLKTTNSGLTWEKVPVPFAYALSAVCFPNGVDTGYVAGDLSGAILKTIHGGGVFTSVYDLPAENQNPGYSFIRNYPNPFTESTTISWKLQENAHVILKIYDLTGREMETLVNCYQSKGEHTSVFNAKGLHAGVYICQLRANGKVETKRMIYLK
jgi:photosystem II stability/assembly factor-like uncharacterized protein